MVACCSGFLPYSAAILNTAHNSVGEGEGKKRVLVAAVAVDPSCVLVVED
jgi:hypothetical protein